MTTKTKDNATDADFENVDTTEVNEDKKFNTGKKLLSIMFGSFKRAAVTFVFIGAAWFMMFGGQVVDQTGYMQDDSYQIHLSDVNARFSRQFIIFGTPELIITSQQMDIKINADGYLSADIKDGKLEGDLDGYVVWTPQFRKDVAQSYVLRGSGITASVDIGIENGEAVVNNCRMAVDIQAWTE